MSAAEPREGEVFQGSRFDGVLLYEDPEGRMVFAFTPYSVPLLAPTEGSNLRSTMFVVNGGLTIGIGDLTLGLKESGKMIDLRLFGKFADLQFFQEFPRWSEVKGAKFVGWTSDADIWTVQGKDGTRGIILTFSNKSPKVKPMAQAKDHEHPNWRAAFWKVHKRVVLKKESA